MLYTAGHVLPDQEGRSRDGIPPADRRVDDASRRIDSQRVLLGAQPKPGRDVHARLVFENRPGLRHRSTGTTTAPRKRAISARTRSDEHGADYAADDGDRAHVNPGGTSLPDTGRRDADVSRPHHDARRASTISRASRGAVLQHELRERRIVNQRQFGGNAVGAWGTYTMNATVDHTEYFSSADGVGDYRQLAEDIALAATKSVIPGRRCISRRPASTRACCGTSRTRWTDCRAQPGRHPARLQPANPFSVQEVAVVHGELDARLARHALHAQSRARPRSDHDVTKVVDTDSIAVLHAVDANRRSRVQPRLGHAEQRLRREVQAHRSSPS